MNWGILLRGSGVRGPGHEDRADEVQLVEADQEQQHQRHLGGVVQEEALRIHLPGEGGGVVSTALITKMKWDRSA